MNPLYNPINFFKKRKAQKNRNATRIRRLKESIQRVSEIKSAQSRTIDSLEQNLRAATESYIRERQNYQEKIREYELERLETQKEKREILEKAIQNVGEVNSLASRRVMAALVAAKQSSRLFDLEEFKLFNESEARRAIVKLCHSLTDENKDYAVKLEGAQEEISRLEEKSLELQSDAFADVVRLFSQVSARTEKAPLTIYSVKGEPVYQSRTYDLLLEKYAPNQRFAIENLLLSPEFREQLYQQNEIIEKYGKLTARFRSYNHDDKQTAISVSLSLTNREEGKRRYKVIKKAEVRALKLINTIWDGCKKSFRST